MENFPPILTVSTRRIIGMEDRNQDKPVEPDPKLRIDYEQTVKYFLSLADTRFRLLALVPTITGIAVALLARNPDPSFVIPVGLLGFFATVGILFYDQRNTVLYDAAQIPLKSLEALLGFPPLHKLEKMERENKKERKYLGGSWLGRPGRGLKLYWIIPMWHDLGLSIVYSAALGGWAFLIVNSLTDSKRLVVGVPVAIGLFFLIGLLLLDNPTDEKKKLRPEIRRLVWPQDFEE